RCAWRVPFDSNASAAPRSEERDGRLSVAKLKRVRWSDGYLSPAHGATTFPSVASGYSIAHPVVGRHPRKSVRNRLPAGGSGIRTVSPPLNGNASSRLSRSTSPALPFPTEKALADPPNRTGRRYDQS